MKQTTVIITIILLAINLLFGLLLSAFKPFNVGFTSFVILLTGALVYLLQVIKLKDAFAISLSFIFSTIGVIQYVLGLISPQHIEDNGYVIATIVLLAIEVIILLICSLTSKSI